MKCPFSLPCGWILRPVWQEFDVTLGKMIQSEPTEDAPIGYPYHKAASVQDGVLLDPFEKMFASEIGAAKLGVRKGDLLVCEGGDIGRSAIVSDEPDQLTIIQNSVHRVRSKGRYPVEYLKLVLDAYRHNGWLDVFIGKNTIAHFTAETFNNLLIPLPNPQYANKAVEIYQFEAKAIEDLLSYMESKLNKLSEYRQSLITQAVTRGLDPNVEMKDSGIDGVGPIAATWFVIPFGKIVQFGRGLPITKANLTESGVPCLSYGGIHAKGNRFITAGVNSLPFVSEDYIDEYPESLIDKGDLVFADTSEDLSGSGNFSCIRSEGKIFAGYHTIICRLSERFKINHIFIGYLLDSSVFRRQIQRRVTGVKVYSVTQQILKSTKVWLPKIEEQEKIARYLDEKCSLIDSTVSEINKSIKKLQEYRSGLISAAVTGKIDISEVNQ